VGGARGAKTKGDLQVRRENSGGRGGTKIWEKRKKIKKSQAKGEAKSVNNRKPGSWDKKKRRSKGKRVQTPFEDFIFNFKGKRELGEKKDDGGGRGKYTKREF